MLSLLFAAAFALIGQPLPEVELATPTGDKVTLPQKGKPVVLDLFATWCGPCRQSIPVLERLRARYGDRVDFVSISEDADAKKVAAFATELKMGSRVLLDREGKAYKTLGAHRLPTSYVVDGNGVVYKINHGFGSGYEARMTKWLDDLLRRP